MAKQPKKPKQRKITEREIKSYVSSHIANSETLEKSDLGARRRRAMEYNLGEMIDTPAKKNRSKAVSKDVADVIGWVLPGVMRVFTASGDVVDFTPTQRAHEDHIEQATTYINHLFMEENDGYRVIWDSSHDALLLNNGIIKHYWDETPDTEIEHYTGVPEDKMAEVVMDDKVEVLNATEYVEMEATPDEQGNAEPVEVRYYDLKVERTINDGTIKIEVIKPDHFLIDINAETIEDTRFCSHWDEKTRSELLEMGFDPMEVDFLPAYSSPSGLASGDLDITRGEDLSGVGEDGVDRSTDIIQLYESYMMADVDGDGIAELVQVFSVGNGDASTVLSWDVWEDEHPFSDVVSERIPHTFNGHSLADDLVDIQQQKTVMVRGLLDNLYGVNNPRNEIEEGSVVNMDELTSPSFGGTIVRKEGTEKIQQHTVQFIGDKALAGLAYLDEVIEKRTGVSRGTMALDPGVLQNQTAEGVREAKDSSYSKIELIARWLAFGYGKMFNKILRLVIKHQNAPRDIMVDKEWVTIDPSPWSNRMMAVVNTGLGTGSRDRDLSMLQAVLNNQFALLERFQAAGLVEQAVDMLPLIINTLNKMCDAAGLKNAEQYYPDFDEREIAAIKQKIAAQAEKPDPKQQAEAAKLQADMQRDQVTMQMDQEKMKAQALNDRAKIETDAALKREQLTLEMELKREQMNAEMALSVEQMNAEIALKREMAIAGTIADAASASSPVNLGGEPG